MAKGRNLLSFFVAKFKSFLYGDKSKPYPKHRRIIHNQTLIQLLFILAVLSPSYLAILVFRLFIAFPSLVILLLPIWAITATFFLAIYLKELKNKE